MGTAVGGVSRAESRTESEIAAPVIEVCTNFIGRGKPLPYGSSHVVGLSSESCQGSLLRELSPEATEGVKFIKVKGRSRCGGIFFTTSSAALAAPSQTWEGSQTRIFRQSRRRKQNGFVFDSVGLLKFISRFTSVDGTSNNDSIPVSGKVAPRAPDEEVNLPKTSRGG